MAQFSVPESPKQYRQSMVNFRGVDFANNATQVKPSRSPDAQNIISDLAGKPVKRTGYEKKANFGARINGIYRLATEDVEKFIVHAGTKLYEWKKENNVFATSGTEIYGDMNDQRSSAFQQDKKLWILDGKTYLVYGEFEEKFTVKKVSEIATVPVCILSLNPDGTKGTQKRAINILSNRRTYSFYGTKDTTTYKLNSIDMKLTDEKVTARKLDSNGKWIDLAETTDFTVDRTKGVITFKVAPGVSPAGAADNVEITFTAEPETRGGQKTEEDDDKKVKTGAELINKCTICAQYGVNGATDRVFVSGNAEAKNFHYWSDIDDPAYFPGFNYAYLGQDSSAIMGYSLIGDSLAVHKEDNEQDQTIFLVSGRYTLDSGATFAVSGGIAGVGAISRYCFSRLGTEPMFLARQGVHAITTQDFTSEKYAETRSWYVDPRLTNEPGLADAVAKEYNNYYYLAVNGHVYVADGRQKNYEERAPQSRFQYEWYYLTNINARIWWEYDGRLYFGDPYGNIMAFMYDTENTAQHNAYNDDGKPIRAFWDTPIFSFDYLSRYKTLKGFWLMLSPYRRSSVEIFYRVKGNLQMVKGSTMDIFDFNDINFERFSFTTDDSPMVVATNAKAKKFMLIQFRFENNVLGEGFGFYEAEASYVIAGKFKG